MQKEVEQYLQICGKIIEPTHVRKVNRKGTCWWIKAPEWSLIPKHFQTVTLLDDRLVLEVWHECADLDAFSLKEILPKKASLLVVRLRLTDMAAKASRQYIKNLAVNDSNFWEDNIREELEMLLPEERESVAIEVEQFSRDLSYLRSLIAARGDIRELIDLHNKIDAFNSRLTQLRLSR